MSVHKCAIFDYVCAVWVCVHAQHWMNNRRNSTSMDRSIFFNLYNGNFDWMLAVPYDCFLWILQTISYAIYHLKHYDYVRIKAQLLILSSARSLEKIPISRAGEFSILISRSYTLHAFISWDHLFLQLTLQLNCVVLLYCTMLTENKTTE